jgi:homeobox-leucine zipper protein
MDELVRLLQTDEPLWMKSNTDGRDLLNLDTYDRMFPKANNRLKNPNIRTEASRDSGVVIMNGLTLVEMFMDHVRISYSFSLFYYNKYLIIIHSI